MTITRKLLLLLHTLFLFSFSAAAQEAVDSATVADVDSMEFRLPYPERAAAAIDSLLSDPMFETSQVGLMVYDLDADSVLYARNHRQLLRPASTMKLLTAITALDRLGERHRLETSLYVTGECDSTSLHGNLFVRGVMDPSFADYDMASFVEGVAALHVDTIRGSIVADRSFKDEKMLGEGWCWDDRNPVLTPLPFQRGDSFLEELRRRLKEQGIMVMGADSIGLVPPDARQIAARYSDVSSLLYRMMKESDNLYAEAMYYQIAAATSKPATARSAQAAERDILEKAGVDSGSFRLADGSGLSLYNYLTAEAEVLLLRYAYNDKRIFGTLCQSLPCAGVDGTLKKRMKQEPMLDNVRAKTGTLTGIFSLAGYATAPDGHLLAFAVINQGIFSGARARDFQDKVCRALCE